jgi:hypothetical protein
MSVREAKKGTSTCNGELLKVRSTVTKLHSDWPEDLNFGDFDEIKSTVPDRYEFGEEVCA